MVSDLYAGRDELDELKFSNDPELQAHAAEATKRIQEELQFSQMMGEEGFDDQPPLPGEMEKLKELIWHAKPFPLHVRG